MDGDIKMGAFTKFSPKMNVNDMNQAVDRLVVGLAFIPYIF
jgi:hypothetical protein